MNTILNIKTALVVAALTTSGLVYAHGAGTIDPNADSNDVTLIYTNPAYSQAIHGSPNAAPERVVGQVNPVYVSQANGPAIYSYPSVNDNDIGYVCQR